MPACLGNTATPHVPLLKKCHTTWYTAPRAWTGQRSGEASPGRAEAGKTNSCTSTWTQEAKTLNCQPCCPEAPQHWHGAFSLHIPLETLRSLRDNISEIFCSIFLPKWEGSHLLVRRIFFPHIILTVGSTHAEPQFSCCVVALPLQPRSLETHSPFFTGHKSFFHDNYFICPTITQSIYKSTFSSKPNYFYQSQYDDLECFVLSSNPKRMTNHWLRHISLRFCPQMLN